MILKELLVEVNKFIDKGYGEKKIIVECSGIDYTIDSIQQDTMPEIEPDYLLIMLKE